jgi:tetratricopeptide (TPR) repeat protein
MRYLLPVHRWIGGLGLALLLCAPAARAQGPTSAAQTEENVNEAKRRYLAGLKLSEEGDYKLALVEFQRAYDLTQNYRVLYNLGQVHFQINNYARALQAFEGYLRDGGSDVAADRRQQVERDIATLKQRTATITVTANVPGAEVAIDEEVIGKAPIHAFLIDAGTHRVLASKDGYRAAKEVVTLAGGETTSQNFMLSAAPVQERIVERDKGMPAGVWISWSVAGLLAVGTLTSGLFLISARNEREEALKRILSVDERNSLDKKVDTWTATTIVAGAATGVAAGVALLVTLTSNSRQSKKDAQTKWTPMVGWQSVGVAKAF